MLLALGATPPAQAADTGWKTAGATVGIPPANWGGTFILANLNTSDNFYAVSNAAGDGILSTFGFGIPAGAKIGAIEVEVEGSDGTAAQTVTYNVGLSWKEFISINYK